MANYPYYMAPQMPQVQSYAPMSGVPQANQIGIKGRPVSSIDEVRATSIDFDGSVFFFPDLANQKIYTKQINIDGTSTLNVYELKPVPVEVPVTYVTKEEFEETINRLKESLKVEKPVVSIPADATFNF